MDETRTIKNLSDSNKELLRRWREGEVTCDDIRPIWRDTDENFIRIRKIRGEWYAESDTGDNMLLEIAEEFIASALWLITKAKRLRDTIFPELEVTGSGYEITKVEADGTIHIGCTPFSAREMRLFARTLKAFRQHTPGGLRVSLD